MPDAAIDKCYTCMNSQDSASDSISISWIQCGVCNHWYHSNCQNLTSSKLKLISEFHCDKCFPKSGPSLLKRVSRRKHKRIDYVALNEGVDLREVNKHPHIERFMNFINDEPIENNIYLVDPARDSNQYGIFDDDCLTNIITKTRLKKPILIPNCNPDMHDTYDSRCRLSFNFPKLSIDELTDLVGRDRKVPVMDVQSQNNSPNWNMNKWKDYFKLNVEDREKILNVISLEFSQTALSDEVELPLVVLNIDIVNKLFNSILKDELLHHGIEKPKVSKYVLMSVKNSFTDFHIDFGGTSVYYSIIQGGKQFLMYPPTERNLSMYERWGVSDSQNTTWFGDLLPQLSSKEKMKMRKLGNTDEAYINNGFKIDIKAGDLLLLPSGWIHAVYTPEDSLILGGNFLNLLSIETHLKVYDIEVNTKVPERFKFPNFIKIVWLIGWYLMQDIIELNRVELDCISQLPKFYFDQLELINDKQKVEDKKYKTLISKIKTAIPHSVIGKPEEFANDFEKWYNESNSLHGIIKEPDPHFLQLDGNQNYKRFKKC